MSVGVSRKVLPLALVVAGCSSDYYFKAPEPADDVAYVGVVFFDSENRFDFASGLSRVREGEPLLQFDTNGEPTAERGVLVGYDEATILALDPPAEEALEVKPVSPAKGCDPPIGTPVWTSPLVPETSIPEVPMLTSAWLSESCPVLVPPEAHGAVDLCGQGQVCAPRVRQNGCTLDVEVARCTAAGVPDFTVKLDRVGRTCTLEPSCRAVDTADQAIASFECRGSLPCPIHIYGEIQELDLIVDRVKVLDYPLLEPPIKKGIAPSDWLAGNLGGLVVLEDRVLVAAYPESGYRRFDVPANVATLLLTLDPETMVVSSTQTASERALMNIIKDPYGMGFVGLFTRSDGPHVGRFSPDGSLSLEADLGVGSDRRPVALVLLPAKDALVAMSTGPSEHPDVAIFDAQTLERRSACQIDLIVHTVDVLALDNGSLAISDDDGDEVLWVEPTTCEITAYASGGAGNFSVGFLYPTGIGDAVIMTTDAANSRGLHFVTRNNFPLPGSTFIGDTDAAVGTLAPFPGDPSRTLVAAIAEPSGARRSMLAEYIIDSPPRVLPLQIELGRGTAMKPSLDARGRLWMTLPWATEVVRISPK